MRYFWCKLHTFYIYMQHMHKVLVDHPFLSRHETNTIRTWNKHYQDIMQTLSRHDANIIEPWSKHHQDMKQTLSRYLSLVSGYRKQKFPFWQVMMVEMAVGSYSNIQVYHCSPTGDTSVTKKCTGLICAWNEHKGGTYWGSVNSQPHRGRTNWFLTGCA